MEVLTPKNRQTGRSRYYYLLLIIFSLLIASRYNNLLIIKNKNVDSQIIYSINTEKLLRELETSDRRWIPIRERKANGDINYKYKKRSADRDFTIFELEEMIKIGPDYFINERNEIRKLLIKLKEIGVNTELKNINTEADGLWDWQQRKISITNSLVQQGSVPFLEVLRHEAIHTAQSCFSGNINSRPVRIGLPLQFSKDIDTLLKHNIYGKNSQEGIYLEREAYTYSKKQNIALNLLNKLCTQSNNN
tara:strand:- start:7242 stop:7985 length:744 start_codon:yes stop_codon:yes gene_type:complete